MIFSKLFKTKWQHKDASVRVLAINDELSINSNDDMAILVNLLSNDESELVRRAVLLKINSFDCWLSASKENSAKKVREFADKQLRKILANEHQIKLSLEEKVNYLSSNIEKSLLDHWLRYEEVADIIISLVKKINKPQMLPALFSSKPIQALQEYIVHQIDDLSTLERLLKKSKFETVTGLISDKSTRIIEEAAKPTKLKKSIQLVLAKLLSLKDISDYQKMLEKKASFNKEWQALHGQLDCLSNEEVCEFSAKYTDILAQLDKIFASKAEAFEQDKIAIALQQKRIEEKDIFDKKIATISQQLATSIYNNEAIDEQHYQSDINTLTTELAASSLDNTTQGQLSQQLKQLMIKLSQLPIIASSVTEATHLISKMSQVTVPENSTELTAKLTDYDEWKSAWKKVEINADGFLPASIMDAYREIKRNWQMALKPLFQEQKQNFSLIQKKLADVKRLIESGKYNAAFGVFKRVNSLYSKLNDQQKLRLQRDFDNVSEKISELSDWEHYIATPRKQQLLTDINQIVEQPLDNPQAQANKVKEYRSKWNSLGHADDDIDKALNVAFNNACEQAFAPCRLYFKEQENLREQHLVVRQQIIDKAKRMANNFTVESVDWKQIDGKLTKLQHQWKEAGEVDREQYKQLNMQFNELIKPIKTEVNAFHETNAQAKLALIKQVELELTNEDVFTAIKNVKTYQTKWKDIGFSGNKNENKLWQIFRKNIDVIFNKRTTIISQQKNELELVKSELSAELTKLEEDFNTHTDKTELKYLSNIIEQAESISGKALAHDPVIKSMISAVQIFVKQVEKAKLVLIESKAKLQWEILFSLLEKWAGQQDLAIEAEVDFCQLSKAWQKKLISLGSTALASGRDVKTTELEILAGIDSPKALTEQRLATQVALMQSQMTTGGKIDLQESFEHWLMLGAFSEQDLSLIERVKPIFC